jgi:hypothetical protein
LSVSRCGALKVGGRGGDITKPEMCHRPETVRVNGLPIVFGLIGQRNGVFTVLEGPWEVSDIEF